MTILQRGDDKVSYVLEVKGVDEVGHVIAAPLGNLGCVYAAISFGSEIFLCRLRIRILLEVV